MPTIDTLKTRDTFPCPFCHRPITMYLTGESRGNMRPHKYDGDDCLGSGYNPFKPDYPQMVELIGKEAAIERVRVEHGDPMWLPEED